MYNHAHYWMVRAEILDAMDRWGQIHQPCGRFLMSVFANDLIGAVHRADPENFEALRGICWYVWNELPSHCHGSQAAVDAWIAAVKNPFGAAT
jgi:hypothetical protein